MSTKYGEPKPVDAAFADDPRAWLAAWMKEGMPWLLAHADDGVIWGRREPDGTLLLSSDVFKDGDKYPAIAVPLRAKTLQQARIFGPEGELLVWRTGSTFTWRQIRDSEHPELEGLPDQPCLLWGLGGPEDVQQGFALLKEGAQGMRHAPPKWPPAKGRLALWVRHYVEYDDQGQAYVACSRLVDLT